MRDAGVTGGFREILAGDRGRLLVGLLFAEFGTAVQTVAESAVLPLANRELQGDALYGATVAAPTLTAILFILTGPALTQRLGPRTSLLLSTVVYVVGVLVAVLAPQMVLVLIGRLLQGAAIGILSGFGLTAIGTLYEDAIRPRVLALFSVAWLLPSILGPVVNSLVAQFAGWRWAMGWPAFVVVAARLLIGRRANLIPPIEAPPAIPFVRGGLVVAGLVLATAAPGLAGPLRVPVWAAGLLLAVLAGAAIVRRLTGGGLRLLVVGLFAGLNVAYFGGEGLLSLGVVEVTGAGVVGASVAYAAGGITWSLLGLRPATGRTRSVAGLLGSVAVTVALAVLAAVTLPAAGVPAIAAIVVAWAIAGTGMGIAFPVLSSRPFDGADAQEVPALSAAVAFVETGGVAVASLLGSGFYSVTSGALEKPIGVGGGYVLAGAVALLVLVVALVTSLDRRTPPAPA